jgi:DNA-binding CsgD family transcriptional regulator
LPAASDAGHIPALAASIDAVGSDSHVDRLTDLIAALAPHDLVTVVRYSVSERPEFVSHRNYSEEMIAAYLERYYPYDPFYHQWRQAQQPGVVRLLAAAPVQYVAEFLVQSVITDELGVLLNDGPGWCLGIFLALRKGHFSRADLARLKVQFPVMAALHALDTRSRGPAFRRTAQPSVEGQQPRRSLAVTGAEAWPELSARELDVVSLILEGQPTAGIALKLGLARGTVKNHRRNIYTKLDITTERELFLRHLDTTRQRA